MEVYIEYRENGVSDFTKINVNVEDYFEFEEDGNYTIDSSPKTYDPWIYIGKVESEISNLVVCIHDGSEKIEYAYTFWNKGKSSLLIHTEITKYNPFQMLMIIEESIYESDLFKTKILKLISYNNKFYIPSSDLISIENSIDVGIDKNYEVLLIKDVGKFKNIINVEIDNIKKTLESIKIIIEYRENNEINFQSIEISCEDYFILNSFEKYNLDSQPKFNEPWNYISKSKEEIANLYLIIQEGTKSLEYAYTFWEKGKSMIKIITESDSSINFINQEIQIVKQSITESYFQKTEILKLKRYNNHYLVPIYDTLTIELNENMSIEDFRKVVLNRDLNGFDDILKNT